MIADLLRAFVEAVVVRELVPQLPAGVRIEALHMYPKGYWSVEWSTTWSESLAVGWSER